MDSSSCAASIANPPACRPTGTQPERSLPASLENPAATSPVPARQLFETECPGWCASRLFPVLAAPPPSLFEAFDLWRAPAALARLVREVDGHHHNPGR